MASESLYLIILETLLASVIASYGTIPYGQYASPYFTGYVYPAQSYTTKPAPGYQPYPYQPVYGPEAPKPPSSYAPAYQPVFTLPTPNMPSYPSSYQPIFAPASPSHQHQSAPSPGPPSPPYPPTSPPASSYAQPYQQVYQSLPSPPVVQTPVLPTESIAPYLPKESPLKPPKPDLSPIPPFDTNVLNNLAIALQLLIVSNLIHNPPLDSNPVSNLLGDTVPTIAPFSIPYIPPGEVPKPIQAHYETNRDPNTFYSIPNANFLGTTGFGDSGISKSMMTGYGSPTLLNPRSLGLMSPYDAIGPNSPFAEPKKEPRSPYHLSSDYKDLFSLTELFKV